MTVNKSGQHVEELAWFKSNYSAGDGGECKEVVTTWRKSSQSSGEGGQCIEIATCSHTVHVRDSKDTSRRGLSIDPAAWSSFVGLARQ
ncbi:DUF397 domain-containing protein [Streptomyces uncialis]|uniref:DUF397 domain-containing protein n=1 Tax=Streptomyces uncialis TaxID=1048205 RepID=UPI00386F23F5|nr:DUF397 domain-containing protein [Streptomyces uncialis]